MDMSFIFTGTAPIHTAPISRSASQRSKIGHHVKLRGPLYGEEKWRKLQKSSIYVLPSYSENFGITVAEALLSGLPAITSKANAMG